MRSARGDAVEFDRMRRAAAFDDLGPLFAPGVVEAPAVSPGDHATSHAAAERVAPIAGALRLRIVELIEAAGADGYTDPELEDLPEFEHYGASTVRKRRSEAMKAGYLVKAGARRGASVWVRTAKPLP